MKSLLGLTIPLLLGCALHSGEGGPETIPISVRSHNRSSVDVYLLCGDRDAQWLGVVHGKDGGSFEIPAKSVLGAGVVRNMR